VLMRCTRAPSTRCAPMSSVWTAAGVAVLGHEPDHGTPERAVHFAVRVVQDAVRPAPTVKMSRMMPFSPGTGGCTRAR
jgi:hypothetical protein